MENKSLKNITFLVSGLSKGGSERVISILSNLYSKQNITINVISMRSIGCYYDFNDNVNIEYISSSNESYLTQNKSQSFIRLNPISIIKKLFKLTKIIKKSNTDIVVAFGESSCLYAVSTKFFTRKPLAIAIRLNPRVLSPLLRFLMIIFYQFADLLILQTNYQKEWADKHFKNLRKAIIENPIEITYSKNPYLENKKSIDFLAVGNVKWEKNYSDLILAFNNIKKKIPNEAKLYCAGRYFTENDRIAITELINKCELNDRVIMLGNVDDVNALYKIAKIYVMSSINEGLSNTLLEAMSNGIPCISSNWSGVSDIISNNKNGIIVPIKDIDTLSEKMLELYNSKELRNQLSENAYLKLKKDFELKIVAQKWLDNLNEI